MEAPSIPSAPGGDANTPQATPSVAIPAGLYYPLYPGKDDPLERRVAAFYLDQHPVTIAQFARFVFELPQWRRSQVSRLWADESYLQNWVDDLHGPQGHDAAPVTYVSWFAARAYADWAGQRLASLAEWEYVAQASHTQAFGREDPVYQQQILKWYAQPTPKQFPAVGQNPPNYFGVQDMHGLVWEWVEDFNSALITGESRGDSGLDRNLFCGSGSLGSADPRDYAAFMRFAFRNSLQGRYAVGNLGFRCAGAPTKASNPGPNR